MPHFLLKHLEIWSECLSKWYLVQVRIWVIWGSETRSIKENIVQTPEAAFLLWASWKFVRMLFWWYLVHVGIWVISGKIIYRSLGQMKENLVNTGGCIQNNCLDVFCITVHCIIKVSDPGPSWPSCFYKQLLLQNLNQ